jgi:trk system potassium uptake protein TrkH
VQTNEGMVLVALMFLFTPLVMSYPLMGSGLGFLDAFFEAISGVTTTGLSTKATLVGAPATFLFSRAWMQWYGGLGIVVLSLALVTQPGLVAKGLAAAQPLPRGRHLLSLPTPTEVPHGSSGRQDGGEQPDH